MLSPQQCIAPTPHSAFSLRKMYFGTLIFRWNQALRQEVSSDTLSLTFFSNRVIFFSNTSNSLFLFTLEKPQGDKYSPDEIK